MFIETFFEIRKIPKHVFALLTVKFMIKKGILVIKKYKLRLQWNNCSIQSFNLSVTNRNTYNYSNIFDIASIFFLITKTQEKSLKIEK